MILASLHQHLPDKLKEEDVRWGLLERVSVDKNGVLRYTVMVPNQGTYVLDRAFYDDKTCSWWARHPRFQMGNLLIAWFGNAPERLPENVPGLGEALRKKQTARR